MNFLNYFGLGAAIIGVIPALTSQIKSPSTLDANTVWSEIAMVLTMLSTAAHVQINMALAQKITVAAVQIIKDAAMVKALPTQ